MRARPPPSDWRIAISVRRAAPRARNMLARLRQATRSTIPAIAIMTADAAVNAVSLVGCEDRVKRVCGAEHERVVAIDVGVLGGQPRRHRFDLGKRAVLGEAGAQTSDHHQLVAIARREIAASPRHELTDRGAVDAERQPEVAAQERGDPAEPVGRHADDGVLLAVDLDRLADHRRVGAIARPVRVADDHRADRRVRLLFFGRERPPQRGRSAQRREVARGDDLRELAARGAVAAIEADQGDRECGQLLEDVGALAQVDVVRIRERRGTHPSRWCSC